LLLAFNMPPTQLALGETMQKPLMLGVLVGTVALGLALGSGNSNNNGGNNNNNNNNPPVSMPEGPPIELPCFLLGAGLWVIWRRRQKMMSSAGNAS
jgi:hypothetical protein